MGSHEKLQSNGSQNPNMWGLNVGKPKTTKTLPWGTDSALYAMYGLTLFVNSDKKGATY